jgi:beta-glucosidase
MIKSSNDFGGNFHWGVAGSAFQYEGAPFLDGKGLSIWDTFSKKKGKIAFNHHAETACDFYNRYDADLLLMQQMHIRNFRLSISWPRILPLGNGVVNRKGLDFYDRLVDSCLEKDITPWITLYHWDLPEKLQENGGWCNRDIIQHFSDYSDVVLTRLGDRVKNWMALNEPLVFAGAGYFLGAHAPGKKGSANFFPAAHHAALCQAEGIRMIQSLVPNANAGTTFSCSYITPFTDSQKDTLAAQRVDALLNRFFLEPLLGLGYPVKDLPFIANIEKYFLPGDEAKLVANPDFIGIQNYTREVVKHSIFTPYLKAKLVDAKKRKVPHTVMNWEVFPQSLYRMLMKYSEYPQIKNLLVTENGAAFPDHHHENEVHDKERAHFLQSCIHEMWKARQDGAKVTGYFVWSFLDNFEWTEGYLPRFGIVHVDYQTQKRTIKGSGKWYAHFLSEKEAEKKNPVFTETTAKS